VRQVPKKLKADSLEVKSTELLKTIQKCCSKSDNFITPGLPFQETIFRVILANGNKPITLAELGEALRQRPGIDVYRNFRHILIPSDAGRRILRDKMYPGLTIEACGRLSCYGKITVLAGIFSPGQFPDCPRWRPADLLFSCATIFSKCFRVLRRIFPPSCHAGYVRNHIDLIQTRYGQQTHDRKHPVPVPVRLREKLRNHS